MWHKLLAVGMKSLRIHRPSPHLLPWTEGTCPAAAGLVEAPEECLESLLCPQELAGGCTAKPSSWAPSSPTALRCPAGATPEEVIWRARGGWGGLWASRTKRKTQPPRAWPTRIACLPRAMCGALRGVVPSEELMAGKVCGIPGGWRPQWRELVCGPVPLPPARHCTKQTTAPERGPGARLLRVPAGRSVCLRARMCGIDCRNPPKGSAGPAAAVSAAGGASPSPRADGLGVPPPPGTHPTGFRSTRGGINLGWSEKVFFVFVCLVFFFFAF